MPPRGSFLRTPSLCAVVFGLVSCAGARYHPPAAAEPHAEVLLKVAYAESVSGALTQRVRINGKEIAVPSGSRKHEGWIRVAPGLVELEISSLFEASELVEKEPTLLPGCNSRAHTAFVVGDCSRAPALIGFELERSTRAACSERAKFKIKPGERVALEYRFHKHDYCDLTCRTSAGGPCDLAF
jgi:hypothetical protein